MKAKDNCPMSHKPLPNKTPDIVNFENGNHLGFGGFEMKYSTLFVLLEIQLPIIFRLSPHSCNLRL